MAISALLNCPPINDGPGMFTKACRSRWTNAIDPGGPATADNGAAAVQIPSTQYTLSTRHILAVPDGAIAALVRFGYDDANVMNADPVVALFGFDTPEFASGPTGMPTKLKNTNSTPAFETTLVTAESTDISDGTLLYTDVTLTDHRYNLLGCPFLIVALKTAATVTSGILTNSVIQVKFIDY
jgi:hypothetical protein